MYFVRGFFALFRHEFPRKLVADPFAGTSSCSPEDPYIRDDSRGTVRCTGEEEVMHEALVEILSLQVANHLGIMEAKHGKHALSNCADLRFRLKEPSYVQRLKPWEH